MELRSNRGASGLGIGPVRAGPFGAGSVRGPGRGGFTLIELLVVIAILSLLVSMLLPSLIRAKDTARDVLCTSRLRNVGIGWQFYLQDSDEAFPIWRQNMHWFYGGKHPALINDRNNPMALQFRPLNPYMDLAIENDTGLGTRIFQCPRDRDLRRPDGSSMTSGYNTYEFYGNSYMLNWLLLRATNPDTGQPIPNKSFYVSDAEISLSRLVLAADCQWYYTVNDTPWDANFHNTDDKMNVVFLDGHAEFMQLVRGEGVTDDYSFLPWEPREDEQE